MLDQDTRVDSPTQHETTLGEAVSLNGMDSSAPRRAHLRGLTMARQAAERRHARPSFETYMDGTERIAAARERTEALRVELARIDTTHWLWLHDHGEEMPERPRSRLKVARTEG